MKRMSEIEASLIFIYKTTKAYIQFQEYIEQKLQGKFPKNKIIDGYLIKKEYLDYWKKFSDFEDLRNTIITNTYNDIRSTLYKYRKSNKYQQYQPDAQQIKFTTPEDFTRAIRKEHKSFVLIDLNFWNLICSEKGLKEPAGMKYSLDKNMITFYFNEFDYCSVITNDNILDASKEMRSTGFDVVRQSDKEEKELEKLLLLYAYEQEMKMKINNLTYRETEFNNYYLISKEWILLYKKFYHYNEICKMIQKKDELKNLLNNGFDSAKKNIRDVLKHISFKGTKKEPDIRVCSNPTLVTFRFTVASVIFWPNIKPRIAEKAIIRIPIQLFPIIFAEKTTLPNKNNRAIPS